MLLLGYVRFIHNMRAQEEMIFAISLPADTRATTVFNAVERYFDEKNIPMQNIFQCALYHDNEEDFERLLLHTSVRWLSKGACMTRFYSLYDSVIEFLSGIDCQLAEEVKP